MIDPNLKAIYADELILAYEREVGRRAAIEFTYVDKKTRDIFEDTCNGNWPDPVGRRRLRYFIMANLPGAQARLPGRSSSGMRPALQLADPARLLHLLELQGQHEDTQNVSAGLRSLPVALRQPLRLSWITAHRFKLNGFFNIKGDWTIGFDGFWASPFTWSRTKPRRRPGDPPATTLLEPRGSREANSNYQLDLQLSKGFTIGRDADRADRNGLQRFQQRAADRGVPAHQRLRRLRDGRRRPTGRRLAATRLVSGGVLRPTGGRFLLVPCPCPHTGLFAFLGASVWRELTTYIVLNMPAKRNTAGGRSPFRLGEWLVEPPLNRLSRGDESIQIELKVMDVLVCLAERPGELVTRRRSSTPCGRPSSSPRTP